MINVSFKIYCIYYNLHPWRWSIVLCCKYIVCMFPFLPSVISLFLSQIKFFLKDPFFIHLALCKFDIFNRISNLYTRSHIQKYIATFCWNKIIKIFWTVTSNSIKIIHSTIMTLNYFHQPLSDGNICKICCIFPAWSFSWYDNIFGI